MNKVTTKIITDDRMRNHITGWGHPESPDRLEAIIRRLKNAPFLKPEDFLTPRAATFDEIALCHTLDYIQIVQNDVEECARLNINDGSYTLLTGDVQISPASLEAALLAAGSVLDGVDLVMTKKAKNVFCSVRPPGHHAESDRGMGFCLFNNVAIGARFLQKKYGIKRVLIVDWDLHHGNGTQEIFYEDPSVFYFSTHQSPLYPGTGRREEIGEGSGKGFTMNCPISPVIFAREEILEAFQIQLREKMKQFKPEFIFISAGFDAHKDDPLGSLNLTTQDFGTLTDIVTELAQDFSMGRVVSVLEGGYNLKALADSSFLHVEHLVQASFCMP